MADGVLLLVEDDPDAELLTLRALRKAHIEHEVVVARNGVEALDYVFGTGLHAGRDMGVMPRVILLDLQLPRIDGLEVLRHLRTDKRTKLIPTVMFSSSTEVQDVVTAYTLGANSYVRKPVGSEQFTMVVAQLAAYWLRLNELPPTRGPRA
jgi:two-component system response regulator